MSFRHHSGDRSTSRVIPAGGGAPAAAVAAAPSGTPAASSSRRRAGQGGTAAAFLAPAWVFYALFLLVPLAGTIALSFTDWDGFDFSQIKWHGVSNYTELVHDDVFVKSLWHSLVFVAGAVVLKTLVAAAIALVLDRRLPLANLFRGVYILPSAISLVVVGVVFSLALSPTVGFVNPILDAIGLSALAGDWLGDSSRVLPVLILTDVWTAFGLYMLLFLARLAAIPQELRDAARVDGANVLQETRHVILPQLRSTFAMVVMLSMIESLKVYATVYTMTRGGPDHASEVLSTWGYFQGFTNNKVGYGSAILVVLLLITLVLSVIYMTRFRIDDEEAR